MKKGVFLSIFFAIASHSFAQVQSTQTNFGKNRVQYRSQRDFVWSYLQGTNFDVYFNEDGRNLAKYILATAPEIIAQTETYLSYRARHRYKFILYNNATDLLQTNIGLDLEQYQGSNTMLATNNRLVLCFSQSRTVLLQDLRLLIAKSLALEMIYDGDFQERIQNTTLISLPDWYIDGFAHYMSQNWNTQKDNALQKLMVQQPSKPFKYYLNKNPELCGSAFWFFLDETYGKSTIANVLYLTRTNRDFDSALRYALGKNMQDLGKDCLAFFKKYTLNYPYYPAIASPINAPELRLKNSVTKIYYKNNRYLHKSGLKYASFSQIVPKPCVALHPNKKTVSIFYTKKGELYFKNVFLNSEGKPEKQKEKDVILQNVDAVYSATYHGSGKKILIQASYKGKLDIAEFYPLSGRVVWLTQDAFDDYTPIYVNALGTKIAYTSNRPSIAATDSVAAQAFTDVFLLLNTDTAQKIYFQATFTPLSHETELQNNFRNPASFVFLSNQAGYYAAYQAQLFTKIDSIAPPKNPNAQPDTVYQDFVINNLSGMELGDVTYFQKTQYFRQQLRPKTAKTDSITAQKRVPYFVPEWDMLPIEPDSVTLLAIDGKPLEPQTVGSATSKTKFYMPVFAREYANIRFGTNLLHPDMPVFLTSSSNLPSREFGIVATAGITDLFENHKLAAGARISNDFSNNDFFVLYQNRARRMDKKLAFHYQTNNQLKNLVGYTGLRNTELVGELAYPINPHSTLTMSAMLRRSYAELLATELRPLLTAGDTSYRATLRFEYRFDNVVSPENNVLLGTRYKFFAENFVNIQQKTRGYGTILGFDIRNYTPIYKQLVWANRLVGNTSLGNEKMLYSAGGTDNWINPKTSNRQVELGDNKIFSQALATNLRGFGIGAKAGFNYLLWNSELRFPLFNLKNGSSTASGFIKNLQLIAFLDAGSAWIGANPFSFDNPNNYEVYDVPPVRVVVFTRENPILLGYGGGVRTKVLGYWLRADYATGIDNNLKNKPIVHLSLGFDF